MNREPGELDCFAPRRIGSAPLPPIALHDPQPDPDFIGRVARAAGYLPPADVLRLAAVVDAVLVGHLPVPLHDRLLNDARPLRAAAAALRGKRPAYEPADSEGGLA